MSISACSRMVASPGRKGRSPILLTEGQEFFGQVILVQRRGDRDEGMASGKADEAVHKSLLVGFLLARGAVVGIEEVVGPEDGKGLLGKYGRNLLAIPFGPPSIATQRPLTKLGS